MTSSSPSSTCTAPGTDHVDALTLSGSVLDQLNVTVNAVGQPDETHHVYVVQLQREVLSRKKFTEANPDYCGSGLCLYVGLTGLSPSDRFDNHKSGYKASKWVRDYGIRLLPPLYDSLNRMAWETANMVEERLAKLLRARGHAVWQK